MNSCEVCHCNIPKPGVICEECYVEKLETEIERLRKEILESLIKRVEVVNVSYLRRCEEKK